MSKKSILALSLAAAMALGVFPLAACQNEKPAESNEYSMDINEQVSSWKKTESNGVSYYAAEKINYCTKPTTPAKQRLNIYIPEAYMNADGTVNSNGECNGYTSANAPILYINSVGAYQGFEPYQMINTTTTAGKNSWYYNYLKEGFVLVFAGARGRSDYDSSTKKALGKAPVALADLKAGIRFLRHNADALPGDMDKIISNGTSAGGAMSTLLAVSGNSDEFDTYLEAMGAVMDEKDDVYAAQIYCPITNLEYADLAYEWMFKNDTSETSKGMSDFQKALSFSFYNEYVSYFNSLNLTVDGTVYNLSEDGRSGTFYNWILEQYAASYRTANGADATLPSYLSSLDTIVAQHNSRSKVCPSFDRFDVSGPTVAGSENSVFGSLSAKLSDADYQRHFSIPVADVIGTMQSSFPDEYAQYYEIYNTQSHLEEVQKQVALYNPYTYLTAGDTDVASKIRICVGSQDSDTSIAISSQLALTFMSLGIDTSYEIMWGFGHTDADTAGTYEAWVNEISK